MPTHEVLVLKYVNVYWFGLEMVVFQQSYRLYISLK